jgi:hypothetical protein
MANLVLKQIVIQQWEGQSGLNGNIVGLSEDGEVFIFSKKSSGWEPVSMQVVGQSTETPTTPRKKSNWSRTAARTATAPEEKPF